MHAVQSAMAVRREREKREQRRQSQIRRSSSKSPRASDASHASADQHAGHPAVPEEPEKAPNPAESSLTAFHLGVVFILLGFLMVFSAMITNSMMQNNNNWSSLLGVGVTFIIVGLIMVMVNRIISAREEEELAKYVSQKLARTRSGYQIGSRDVEAAEADQPQSQLQPPIQPQLRRAMSTRVHSNVSRKASTRRSMRVVKAPSHEALKGSNSTQSHLSVKNGNSGTVAEKTELVTETETVLPKQDNKPALVVTKESRRPSKRVKKPTEEPKSTS